MLEDIAGDKSQVAIVLSIVASLFSALSLVLNVFFRRHLISYKRQNEIMLHDALEKRKKSNKSAEEKKNRTHEITTHLQHFRDYCRMVVNSAAVQGLDGAEMAEGLETHVRNIEKAYSLMLPHFPRQELKPAHDAKRLSWDITIFLNKKTDQNGNIRRFTARDRTKIDGYLEQLKSYQDALQVMGLML
ncbi:MAG: hypothetical protein EP335_05175 [Alphaproteobacteria bacterium]|nr:MAG: hypothetical protein EP335_05175 [Alphaproteobacteria bacterium]